MSNFTNKNNFTVTIDGKDRTKHVQYPIKWNKQLDETLDQTRLSVKRLKSNIIHPLTPLSVTMTDKKGKVITLDTIVTTDEAAELPVGNGTFDHEIMCLEETKLLEGIVVDALTFTNDLGRNYINNAVFMDPTVNNNGGGVRDSAPDKNQYKNVVAIGSFTAKSISEVFSENFEYFSPAQPNPNLPLQAHFHITLSKNNSSTYLIDERHINYTDPTDNATYQSYSAQIESGTYILTYRIYPAVYEPTVYTDYIYTFNAADNYDPLPRWNIASVIDRVLEVAETHLEGVSPRFALNAEQHALFEQIEAPEFAFTNSTLKEILDQIGGYIHGIPRLKGNTIYFDMLGGTKQAKIADPKYAYISNMYSQDVESYCTALDSTVDNLVCLTDRAQGTITEPYNGGGKSLRTETVYARVDENNGFVSTDDKIYEVVSVVCTNIPGKSIGEVDITPYVFEASEYARQSSYNAVYPNSKVFAIYYTQGQKNIQGLNFKQIKVNGDVFGDYAIIRILEEASGKSIGSLGDNYPALAFRISYIPIFSARTQQTKQYISDYKQPRALVYNQGANVIETRHFGENMKGAVARMGNVDRVVTYNLGDFSLIPEMGEMFGDDYWISGVACELYPNHIKCMLTLSQDFNRLSQYIGINSVRRFYEVSEKQAYRRDIKYADYLIIGDKVEQDETLLRNAGFLFSQLAGHSYWTLGDTNDNPTEVIAQGYEEDGSEAGAKVSLPVVSTAQGTAMAFTFSYEDNYSAGNMVQHETEGNVPGYFTTAVPYGNYYGRMHALKFQMMHEGNVSEELSLPLTTQSLSSGVGIIRTENNGIVVKKDGAEILSFNYIAEFVTNRRNYIIGTALTQGSPLVKKIEIKNSSPCALYVFPQKLSKFAQRVDIANATKVWEYYSEEIPMFPHMGFENGVAKLEDFTPTVDGAAWAIATESGELLFGSNEPITAGQAVSMPYISLRHDIFNLGGNS